MGYVAGIDLGTSSVKVLIADLSGKALGIGQVGYEVDTPRIAYAEQDPEIWWRSTREAASLALARSGVRAEEISGIGFSGQMHGLVALDREEKLVGPAIIWMDQRSIEETAEIREAAGELLTAELLNQPGAGMMVCSLLWLKKHSPEVYEKIDKVMLPKDYIRYRLTGNIGSDYSDACATLAFSVRHRRWCTELIKRLGLKADIWPEVRESSEVVGEVTSEAAVETGFAAKTKVTAGGGDSAIQLVGNGVTEEGTLSCNIGTASQLAAVVGKPVFDSRMRLQTWCHPVRDTWYVQGGALNGGSTLSWLRNKILRDGRPFAELDREAGEAPAGSEGLIFLPFLAGERTPFLDPQAKGVYFGLSMKHDQSHIIRATMEGVLYNLKECGKILDEMGLPRRRLVSSGGAAKGMTWKQIQADILDMPVYTTGTEEEACLGAAVTAAVGVGVYGSVREACGAMVQAGGEPVLPIPEHVKRYEEQQEKFGKLCGSVRELFRDSRRMK